MEKEKKYNLNAMKCDISHHFSKIFLSTANLECEDDAPHVSATEKRLLRNAFMNTMYESFLSGKDKDYDYESVDNNADFDSLQTRQHDEEEKYFDAEEPEILDTVA
ncbi:coiled-coil domain-containing protein 97-like [Rhipicephalus microplus]|uniref:coiled-coil domain-containing protein 97-like n=1 Tax=Rhipicephalus microplus TaxID=6941 RepID=UPI003F6B9B28